MRITNSRRRRTFLFIAIIIMGNVIGGLYRHSVGLSVQPLASFINTFIYMVMGYALALNDWVWNPSPRQFETDREFNERMRRLVENSILNVSKTINQNQEEQK